MPAVVVALGLWSGILAAGAAAEPHVTCVQEQLTALGYDPGPVDGQSGPRTRGAVSAFLKDIEGTGDAVRLDGLPAFSERAAVGWCREIAELRPEAVQFMPSQSGPEIHVPEGFTPAFQLEILIAFDAAAAFLRDGWGLRLASQVRILAAEDPVSFQEVARRIGLKQELVGEGASRAIARICKQREQGVSGLMSRTTMVLCWPANFDARDHRIYPKWRKEIRAVVAHEFMHHVQRELSHDKVPQWVRRGQNVRHRVGPAWMAEGSAQYIEYSFAHRVDGARPIAHAPIRGKAWRSELTLTQIREEAEVDTADEYLQSLYAVYLLTQRAGEDSLLEYWRRLGETDSWEKAFEATYGIRLADFEAMYPMLRGKYQQAIEFIENADNDGDGLIAGIESLKVATADP